MFHKFGPSGGSRGTAFEAKPQDDRWKIDTVRVWSSTRSIHAIEVVWTNGQEIESSPVFGARAGDKHDFGIEPDDYLVGIAGSTEGVKNSPFNYYYVSSLQLFAKTKESPLFGSNGDASFRYDEVRRHQIIGFHGLYDDELTGAVSALGVIIAWSPVG